MELSDIVIATEEDVEKLYNANGKVHYGVLTRLRLLPLTPETFTNPRGEALLHFATWVFFKGYLTAPHFLPVIHADNALQEGIKKRVEKLGTALKPSDDKYRLYPAKDAGAWGRLLHAMGIPVSKKGSYKSELPKYIRTIMSSQPARDPRRKGFLKTITKICLLSGLTTPETAGKLPFLDLGYHETDDTAQRYGEEIVGFLNISLKCKQKEGLFGYDQIKTQRCRESPRTKVRLDFTGDQLVSLLVKNQDYIELKIKY